MTNLLNLQTRVAIVHASNNASGSAMLSGFTGSNIPAFGLPQVANPIVLACELSELARLLGGEFTVRPANTGHCIFLL